MRGRLHVLAVVAFAAGCASRPLAPMAGRAWTATLTEAEQYALAGEFTRADSVLGAYAVEHPRSPDTLSVLFWRALYRADPANPDEAGAAVASALLDRYLSAEATQPHRYEAQALRRLIAIGRRAPVVRVDTLRTVDTAAVRAAVAREVEARNRTRELEIQPLRDSLARTTAELERIRRRLAEPRP